MFKRQEGAQANTPGLLLPTLPFLHSSQWVRPLVHDIVS